MAAEHGESIKNQTSFSLQLTKALFQLKRNHSNLVFSPLSIHILVSLLAAGSKGQTLDHLLSLLGSPSMEELNSLCSKLVASVLADSSHLGGPKISCANSVWIQEDYLPLKPTFSDIVSNVYRAAIKPVDFKHKADEINTEVNSWAEKETMGLIKELLPRGSIDSSRRFILANALYFRGAWQTEFDVAWTREYDFHLLNGNSVRVPFMTKSEDVFVGEHDGFKILRLPYRQGEDKRGLSMYIILPDAMDGLPALVEKVASEPGFLDCYLQEENAEVEILRLPKFKISFGFEASGVLEKLGLEVPLFLNEMVDSPKGSFSVSKIIHKSFIEVDEEGTQAAAVTIAEESDSLFSPVDFVADHPFLFLIRENATGVVLFIGRVLDPSLSS